jgi:hypothetical protein
MSEEQASLKQCCIQGPMERPTSIYIPELIAKYLINLANLWYNKTDFTSQVLNTVLRMKET